jgi:hypothetical protein
MRDILLWVAVVELLGAAALPFTRAYFDNRRDAALLARPVGLALVGYVGWALTRLLTGHFHRGTLLAAFVAVAAAGLFVSRRRRAEEQPAAAPETYFGAEEKLAALIFWSTAGVFLLIRAAVPEIAGTEKFMDLAFLNSLTRHDQMPPLDPWMAGLTINYYYWGYLLPPARQARHPHPQRPTSPCPLSPFCRPVPPPVSGSGCPEAGWRRVSAPLSRRCSPATCPGPSTSCAARSLGTSIILRPPASSATIPSPTSTRRSASFRSSRSSTPTSTRTCWPFFIAAFALAHRFIERASNSLPGVGLTFRWSPRRCPRPFCSPLMAGTSRPPAVDSAGGRHPLLVGRAPSDDTRSEAGVDGDRSAP